MRAVRAEKITEVAELYQRSAWALRHYETVEEYSDLLCQMVFELDILQELIEQERIIVATYIEQYLAQRN